MDNNYFFINIFGVEKILSKRKTKIHIFFNWEFVISYVEKKSEAIFLICIGRRLHVFF
jgi:hypothetical protein